jgi:hypothetical protein
MKEQVMSDENATTEYGSWNTTVDPGTLNAGHMAVESLAEWASYYDAEGLSAAFRDAIDAALPDRVSLCGDRFIGPYRVRAGEWDGYPTTEVRLDIKAIVDGIDFWRLARAYDRTATLYLTIEVGEQDTAGKPAWHLVTDMERIDQDKDTGTEMTAVELAEFTAGNQTVVDQDVPLWRVRVWASPDEWDDPAVAPLAEHVHEAENSTSPDVEMTRDELADWFRGRGVISAADVTRYVAEHHGKTREEMDEIYDHLHR